VASEPTPSQTVGPFFSFGLLEFDRSQLVSPEDEGAMRIGGRVLDGDGQPVPDAMVEIWQAHPDGRYVEGFGWARSGCDDDGRYSFVICRPGRVPDGNGGLQAPHVSMLVFARGLLKPVRTRMYFPDEDSNGDDRILSSLSEEERRRLIARPGLEFDVRLQGPEQTPFFAV
jgi:protocatechuate 3,4-dioxygenase, alpha subunit